jgi:hypothetical protein
LIEQLRKDEAIAAADTLLLTVPIPIRRRLQCACPGGNSNDCPPGTRLTLKRQGPTNWLVTASSAVLLKRRFSSWLQRPLLGNQVS